MALRDVASKKKNKNKNSQDKTVFTFAKKIAKRYQAIEAEIAIAMDGTDTEYDRGNFLCGALDALHAEVCKPKPRARAKAKPNSKKGNARTKK